MPWKDRETGKRYHAEYRRRNRARLLRRQREWRRKTLEAGLCVGCASRNSLKGNQFCRCCRDRRRAQSKAARLKNPGYMREYAWRLKLRCLEAYGGPRCVCCGEGDPRFLTLDHVNNDGFAEKRSGYVLYLKLIRNGFKDKLQVMCYNCNCARYRNGNVCPHKDPGTSFRGAVLATPLG